MELTKKTTILFPPELHDRLVRLARDRRTSLGELGALALPVASPAEMKREAVTPAEHLLP